MYNTQLSSALYNYTPSSYMYTNLHNYNSWNLNKFFLYNMDYIVIDQYHW